MRCVTVTKSQPKNLETFARPFEATGRVGTNNPMTQPQALALASIELSVASSGVSFEDFACGMVAIGVGAHDCGVTCVLAYLYFGTSREFQPDQTFQQLG